MKISKVNHVRMGTMKSADGKNGFLYKAPSKPDAKINIEKHVNSVLRNASRCIKNNGRDYSAVRGMKDAASIILKDTKVQVYDIGGGEKILALSSSRFNGKDNSAARSKHLLFDYICEYANASQDEQGSMEKDMLTLIQKYIYVDNLEAVAFDVIDASNQSIEEAVSKCSAEIKNIKNRKANAENKSDSDGEKDTKHQLRMDIRKAVNNALRDHYVRSTGDASEIEKFWISRFSSIIYDLYADGKNLDISLLNCNRLAGYLYKEWKSYMAGRIIDMGKAVYHFTDLGNYGRQMQRSYGEIRPEYANGISSFDYEKIKAEETLNRDIANAVTFAANVFAINSTSQESRKTKNDPIIDIKDTDRDCILDGINKKTLQFFGGISLWNTCRAATADKLELFKIIRHQIRMLRNDTYHYSTDIMKNVGTERMKMLDELFSGECEQISRVIVKKYYSNNVPMFYKEEDIRGLISALYSKKEMHPSQIPAFASILKRKDFIKIISGSSLKPKDTKVLDVEYSDKYVSALYFVLKEIYYNKFIVHPDAFKMINSAINTVCKDNANYHAARSFKNRVREIEDSGVSSLSELCQILLTDVNMQNNNKSVKQNRSKTSGESTVDSGKFQHFKMILLEAIRLTFLRYVASEPTFSFLKNPSIRELPAEASFIPDWKANYIKSLNANMDADKSVNMAWYITAHFLTSKQTNHLIGSIKEYVQYLINITARAKSVGVASADYISRDKILKYENITNILEMVLLLSGRVSNNILDYFDSEEEYKQHILQYFDEIP